MIDILARDGPDRLAPSLVSADACTVRNCTVALVPCRFVEQSWSHVVALQLRDRRRAVEGQQGEVTAVSSAWRAALAYPATKARLPTPALPTTAILAMMFT